MSTARRRGGALGGRRAVGGSSGRAVIPEAHRTRLPDDAPDSSGPGLWQNAAEPLLPAPVPPQETLVNRALALAAASALVVVDVVAADQRAADAR
ncbi:hypothetical protein C5C41_10315 [Rathayibacter sp. AY1E9]|nr:hypothetical protein C5C41_10315 [Rathayibacter sp. AY1E9]